jgi:hypothetical protein
MFIFLDGESRTTTCTEWTSSKELCAIIQRLQRIPVVEVGLLHLGRSHELLELRGIDITKIAV